MKNRRRNKRSRNSLSFQQLEPRNLLAGDISAGANLITNGDFSQFTVDNGSKFFDQDDVAGWNAANDADGQRLKLSEVPAARYGTVLLLDSSGNRNDRVFQDVDTVAGQQYAITFDLRGQSPESGPVTESVFVFWNNEQVGEITPDAIWSTRSVLVTGTGDGTRLEFREQVSEAEPNGDGLGVVLDNISVAETTAQTVTNGGFETFTGDGPRFENGEVDQWFGIRNNMPPRIEIASSATNPPPDGSDNFLDLDSTADRLDHVYTDLTTVQGREYLVLFDLRTDGANPVGDDGEVPDEVRVRWKPPTAELSSDQHVATIRGSQEWKTYGVVVTGFEALSRLEFREPGGQPGDGSGAFIDNVRLLEIGTAPSTGVNDDLAVDANGTSAGSSTSATVGAADTNARVTPSLVLTNSAGANLTSATATITVSEDRVGERLTVNELDTGLTQNYDASSNTLTVTGSASVADYQRVLRTLRYHRPTDEH